MSRAWLYCGFCGQILSGMLVMPHWGELARRGCACTMTPLSLSIMSAKLFPASWHKVFCVCVCDFVSVCLSVSVWLNLHTNLQALNHCVPIRYVGFVPAGPPWRAAKSACECITVCVRRLWHSVNFQLEITLLLIAPRRQWSITVINKDRPVCQEAPTSLGVRWQWQRRFLIEDGILPPAIPQKLSQPLILLCNYHFPLLAGSRPTEQQRWESRKGSSAFEFLSWRTTSLCFYNLRDTSFCTFMQM